MPLGFVTVCDFSFETAAYVSRYVVDKINGDLAVDYYKKVLPSGDVVSLLPEFGHPSVKPGLGFSWIEKFGKSDVFSYDNVVVRGVKCKPPRYYDEYLAKLDLSAYQSMKSKRLALSDNDDDNSYRRLLVREKCLKARVKCLVREIEDVYV